MSTSLTHNPKTGAFVLTSNDRVRAEAVGLTLSTRVRGPNGELVWFTADAQQKPAHNAYAALPFWDVADGRAREQMASLHRDYEASWAEESSEDFPCPRGEECMPFQNAGVSYTLNRFRSQKGVIIGDEPGLGKTIEAIVLANALEAQRILVVCPATIRLAWQREVRKWSTILRVSTYPILKSSDGVNPYTNYVIISYDLMRNEAIHAALYDIDWDLIILDEGHYLKTIEAQRTRAVFGGGKGKFQNLPLTRKAKKIVALTGTLLPNRPRECFTLTKNLCWEAIDWANYDDFRYRFNPSALMDTGYVLEKKGRLPELQSRLRCNLMVRRLKKDVLKDLPDKRYEFAYIEPNGAIKQVLAKEKMIDFDPTTLFNPDFEIDGAIATVRREMGEAMAPRVAEHMRYLLDIVEFPKIVMFAHHRSVMDILVEKLHSYGMVMVRGGIGTTRKDNLKDEFISNPKIRIYLGQLDTMEGVDGLQHATDRLVFAEPAWTPGRNEQCVDRCHRYGQHGNVVAQFMIVQDSFNEKVLDTVLGKTHAIHDTLDRRH